jgi:COP9 signalosome complex subunit 7
MASATDMEELNKYCIMAQNSQGHGCADIIQKVLKSKNIFVFGELLAISSVEGLRGGEFGEVLDTLELFAYKNFTAYAAQPDLYLPLSPEEIFKLRQLTLIDYAVESKVIEFEHLKSIMKLKSSRELESLIIASCYKGLIIAKIDQALALVRVKETAERDVHPNKIGAIIGILDELQKTALKLSSTVNVASKKIQERRLADKSEHAALQEQVDVAKKLLKARMDSHAGNLVGVEGRQEMLLSGGTARSGRARR